MKRNSRIPLICVALTFVAAIAYLLFLGKHWSRRAALNHAGDTPLPGTAPLQSPTELVQSLQQLEPAGRAALAVFLRLDYALILLLFAFVLSIAWALRGKQAAGWFRLLVAVALLYAVADATENSLLLAMLASGGADLALWSVAATKAKLALVAGGGLLVFLGLLRLLGSRRSWWFAFFQDIPYIIDSLWRRTDFLANREFSYVPASANTPACVDPRPYFPTPPVLFFTVTMAFVVYGPTAGSFCSLAPRTWAWLLPAIPGAASLALLILLWPFRSEIQRAVRGRFVDLVRERVTAAAAQKPTLALAELRERLNVTSAAMLAGSALVVVPLVVAAIGLLRFTYEGNACEGIELLPRAYWRLTVLALAVVSLGVCFLRTSHTAWLVGCQATIAGTAGVVLWFALAEAGDREADRIGYRHVFGAFAPFVLVSLALAPLIAAISFRALRRSSKAMHPFRFLLRGAELFVPRTEMPAPGASRALLAALEGISYRVLQFLLPPALLGFVAPADWLGELVGFGFVLSLLLGTWGNLSRRWQQMTRQVERWFLSGTAFFVSVFVILVAALRVLGVDYVTTIIDAAPFGVLFALVVMSYVLSWLVEYWVNRVVASELLSLLGASRARPWVEYRVRRPGRGIKVAADGRFLGYHSIGRFLVVGSLSAGHKPTASAREPKTAFHSYELLELFRVLARRDSDQVAQVIRATSLYFFAMNAVLIAAFAVAGAVYWYLMRPGPDTVVAASANAPKDGLKDLAVALAQPAQEPAIVVVGSGGGTRAALYTSHVLQGLHELERDRNIVLLSGVSGGGVALAYFAAWHARLTQSTAPTEEVWNDFRKDVAGNLIGDVIAGASEWRMFGPAPLSILLAESFQRHLLKRVDTTMQLPGAPALILNTTITGHPVEDSEILMRTLDRAPAGDCDEAARPYTMMQGGRLVFTNLKSTEAFPTPKPGLANTRLPYVVVSSADVSLARAAALNANFPPVFPNALVRIRAVLPGTPCAERSYFVTDGGALENLGLVSALYAVQSALLDHENKCPNPAAAGCRLRPLHFVIAEASATGYDYRQDRGLSTGLGGSGKERLTGLLTQMLLDEVKETYKTFSASVHVHYLPLPLPFRARGGFGTHWMHAPSIEVNDPRPRTEARGILRSATLDEKEVDRIWLALHDTRTPYCRSLSDDVTYNKLKRWICGAARDEHAPRDLHVDAWQTLIKELR